MNRLSPSDHDLTVLLLPGVVTRPARLRGWMRTLREAFPGARVWSPRESFYWPWGPNGQLRVLDAAVRALREAGPAWLLAHSFGGLLARAALARVPGHQARLLTTMASPHRYPLFGIDGRGRALGVVDSPGVPALSYGGYFDVTVPYPCTPLAGARHRNLPCGHLGFLYTDWVRRQVIADARALLEGTGVGSVGQPPETPSETVV